MTDQQPQLFEWDLPTRKPRKRPGEPTIVERRPGWFLVVNQHRRAQYWHRIRIYNNEGGVVTVCGLLGRIVSDECGKISLCPDCESDTTTPEATQPPA